jgi:hypothetical protein
LADKLTQLILDALGKAALAPGGTPLTGTKVAPGLFAANIVGRQAAEKARADGLIRRVAPDPKGKADRDLYATTAAGLDCLLRQTSPKQVLEDLARAVEARHTQFTDWLTVAKETHAELAAVREILSQVIPKLAAPTGYFDPASAPSDWLADLRTHLAEWDEAGDCPLPELYRRLRGSHPALSIGQFHDGLRELHDREQVYLHPWTGPLYALPEPAFALMIGHEVAFYASLRSCQPSAVSHQLTTTDGRRLSECRYDEVAMPAVTG